MFDFDKEEIIKIILISLSSFILLFLIFPSLLYIIVILGVLIPTYILYKKNKDNE
jgi:hypothetical protein